MTGEPDDEAPRDPLHSVYGRVREIPESDRPRDA